MNILSLKLFSLDFPPPRVSASESNRTTRVRIHIHTHKHTHLHGDTSVIGMRRVEGMRGVQGAADHELDTLSRLHHFQRGDEARHTVPYFTVPYVRTYVLSKIE